ncbi:ABC transporter permease [Paenibacillus sp. 598K]|uniref:ABC transporter permease n=1 Tax=Paenibacillus sp. 598K TaxID=1117987 RepID=UPI000FF9705A|nr:ABC transporter permease [Paenibacillus sp. 598K]GBF76976.1 ABC transporter permease [Paenibacillus sp. 598K]
MSHAWQIAIRELRMGLRNPWAYSFLGLFVAFMLSLLLIQSQGYVQGYTGVTGTMLNLIIYLLPLMTLMLGSFSLTGEREDGNWELLSAYPIRTWSWMLGKYAGLAVVLLVICASGFGAAGLLGWLSGGGFELSTYGLLLVFAGSLTLMFLAVALAVGTVARNRWQALTIAVAIWFFAVIGWAPLLIGTLGMLPYMWIKPAVTVLTALNPAELTRLFVVVKLGAGSVLGPEYYDWVRWIRGAAGTIGFAALCALWIAVLGGGSAWLWERRRSRG